MDRALRSALVALLLLLSAAGGASFGLINPHLPPEPCGSCHAKVPTKEEGAAGNYFLLKKTIDETCHVCHETGCCRMGNLSGHFPHPSGIDTWDKEKFRHPKSLPLFNGAITCSTCHLHSLPQGESFKMVRLVTRDKMRIEWIRLCRDCHLDQ